ncbi:hypothetical protein IVA95_23530 [Bradyrhizobium sp. 157]|uniref:hypothetical protein n=1 Tax=Bradyrhizobium sp. 157 TaxID=2782631 RepID=UPI001FFA7A2C|nr:hypothetical protein [Bradyrhizobium sp. 157]MCK1640474.1 hypothetical protein [Bradyrhizobium sp. 157]
MPNNIYRFRHAKWANPKRFKLIADSQPSWLGSRYLSGFIVLCVLTGFVAVQAWPKFKPEPAKLATLSIRVIDGDTVSLGMANQSFVWLDSTRQKWEAGPDAKLNVKRAKPPHDGFASLSAMADPTFSKSRVRARPVRKAQMLATSDAAAARFEPTV